MFVFNRTVINSINYFARWYSISKKCPYDVLKLRKNCTDKEIKAAYIKLSKEYHPDMNKDARAQERFVNIVEAYNVLGKPSSRAQYDLLTSTKQPTYVHRTHVPWNLRKNPDYQYEYQYHYQPNTSNAQQARKEKSYYGVTGVNKLPNYTIIMICCGFALVGLVIQLAVIRKSFIVHRDNIDSKSRVAAEELNKVRAAAGENGNEVVEPQKSEILLNEPVPDIDIEDVEALKGAILLDESVPESDFEVQTRLLLEKIVNGANPTVATAGLGQTLAAEKKESSESEHVLTEYGISEGTEGDWYISAFKTKLKKNPKGFLFEFETWFD